MGLFFKRGLLKKYANQFLLLLAIQDLFISYIAALIINHSSGIKFELAELSLINKLLIVSFPIVLFFSGVYQPLRGKSFLVLLRALAFATCCLILLFVFYDWLLNGQNGFLLIDYIHWLALSFFLIIMDRIAIYSLLTLLRKYKFNQRNVLILTIQPFSSSVLDSVLNNLPYGYNLLAFFTDATDKVNKSGINKDELPYENIPDDLEAYVRDQGVDEFWIFADITAMTKVSHVLNELYNIPISIRFFPDVSAFQLLNNSVGKMAGLPVINLIDSPMRGYRLILKSLEDKILSLCILILVSPLLLILALLVKLSSPGPIFFKQERMTWNGRKFNMLKFRSMPVNAEQETGAVWCNKSDSRATAVGSFLRKTSLDELPQFINVLLGDMSIVGPRPERPVFVDKFKKEIPGYMHKHLMKAGITGWAQINGWRGDTDLAKRIEYDLYYIENWSLLFDLKIIFLTLFKGFIHKNAY